MTDEEREKQKQYARTYREANPDKVRASQRRWRDARKKWGLEHPIEALEIAKRFRRKEYERHKVYRKTHEVQVREARRKWRANNRDRARAYERKYYALNREKFRAKHRAYAQQHPSKVKATNAKQRERYKPVQAAINALKLKMGCCDCGYNTNPVALDFDHVRGKKTFNVCYLTYNLKRALAEIEKCELRCANCHRIATHNRRRAKQTEVPATPLPSLELE
jgi:hypothetical protein